MKKRFLTLLLSATMLFSVAGFSACTNGELEAKIAELQAQITELQEQNEELQASVEEQQTQIADLEQENQELEEEIEYLEGQISENIVSGTFYSLEEAYDLGYINKNDLMHIVYYYRRTVYVVADNSTNSLNWIELDFIPEKELGSIKSEKELAIKSSFIYHNERWFANMNYEEAMQSLTFKFLGEYDGYYAVKIDAGDYGEVEEEKVIDGIAWFQSGASILLYSENK